VNKVEASHSDGSDNTASPVAKSGGTDAKADAKGLVQGGEEKVDLHRRLKSMMVETSTNLVTKVRLRRRQRLIQQTEQMVHLRNLQLAVNS
jgi:hypothetical protein